MRLFSCFTTLGLAMAAPFAAILFATTPLAAAELKPLVDVDWLQANKERDDVVILDIRNKIDGGSKALFEEGHIPGAIYSNYLDDGWRTTVDGVVGQTPPVEDLERLIGDLGIDNETTVVIVPAGVSSTDFGSATRVYWTFNYLGHDEVAILNGGYRAWIADPDQDVATGPVAPEPARFDASVRPELLADTAMVEARLERGDGMLVDGRPLAQFAGEAKHEAAMSAGHIPGAVHFDQAHSFDEANGKMLDTSKLESLIPPGLKDDTEVISYCNTGHWASVNWFVLSELMGKEQVKLYDGSMVGWTQDPSRPVDQLN